MFVGALRPAAAEPVPAGYVVDPRYPFTLELAPVFGVPVAGTVKSAAGQELILPALGGFRASGFVPVGERLQLGGGFQGLWTAVDGESVSLTTLVAGARWLQLEDRWRTAGDLQLAVDVGSAFAIGVRAAGSVAYELPLGLPGLFAQATLGADLLVVRIRATVTLSMGLSYAW